VRGLFGDFRTMPLKDLVVYLGNKHATGTLALERAGVRKSVAVKNGLAINASSNEPREYLGQFLINMGHITEDQFNKAYQTQKETKIFLGKILVMIGLVSEETVRNALSMKIRETMLEAFNWEDGTFNFDSSDDPEFPDGLELQIELVDIHREGEFRETAWQAIRAVFPTGKLRLSLEEKNLPERPKPGSLDERLVALIKQGSSIDDMVLALHATDFYLYQRLYALYRLDAVKPIEPGSAEDSLEIEIADPDEPLGAGNLIVGDEPSIADIVSHAESFIASGNFVDAEALARKANELSPTAATAELLRNAEQGLQAALRQKLMEGRRVPALLVPAAKLKGLQMTAPERYLLSRIDGQRDVASIIQVSPLRELDALKFFRRFVEAGLVKVT
jgi:hypothetical protein